MCVSMSLFDYHELGHLVDGSFQQIVTSVFSIFLLNYH